MVNKVGGPGSDDLVGTTGNDKIDGKGGADDMTGLTGNDIYIVDDVGDNVFENFGEGTDTVQSSISIAALFANVENLTLTGTLGLNATGNKLFNIITGNSGDNTLDGGGFGEADSLVGGKGNDTYIVDNTGDLLKEGSNAGTDTVVSSVNWTLGTNFENLTAGGKGVLTLTGNSVGNTITGNDDGNFLNGGGGNDILIGGKGNDFFDTGVNAATGADNMSGGDGDDTYTVDNGGDVVNENPGEGNDTVLTSFNNYTLTANVENLTLTGKANINGNGNGENNVITGNSGNNILTGGAGNDTLDQFSNGGNDTLFGGADDDYYLISVYNGSANVSENFGEGTDTVETDGSYTLTNNVENLILGANAADAYHYLYGNGLNNTITNNSSQNAELHGQGGDDILVGTATGYNYLYGESNNDTLTGGMNSDVLDGGAGDDSMAGGDGNDDYYVDSSADVIIENPGEGTDTIYSFVSRTIDANVENLYLIGGGALNGVGNAENNYIEGNSSSNVLLGLDGDDVLNGAGGADVMAGGKGDDSYYVDNAGDSVTEVAGEGTADRVYASISYTLTPDVELLFLTGGAGAINGTGNAGDNQLFGNESANTLDGAGSTGGDQMFGGGGNDVYLVRNVLDFIQENPGEGTDTVQTYVDLGTGALFADVENLVLADPAVVYGTGNALSNQITGNGGDNTLDGQGGGDVLIGGAGNDFYFVRASNDFLIDSAGTTDQLLSFTSFNMALNAANVEIGALDASAGNANLTGNALDNTLTGNASNNTLDGGVGADTMIGGGGDDAYVVDNAGDVVTGDTGIDTVFSSLTYSIAADAALENITLTGTGNNNATGNAGNNTLIGNDGNNLLNGGAGADYMAGGKGDDTMVVDDAGDVTAENANEGTDTVNASVSHTMGANIENMNLLAAGLTGTGNSIANNIIGHIGGSTIFGMGGDDVLTGLGGDDSLDGGTGADFMIGGAGNNVFFVDNANDFVDNGGAASGVINSTISWDLSNGAQTLNVADLNLIGTGTNLVGTGTAGVNTLNNNTTGVNAVTLNGGAGADVMANNNNTVGATTLFIVDNLGDTVTGNVFSTDNIQSGVDFTLGANQENLTLTGSAINGTGNAVTNTIVGTSGNNTLDGGAGSDRLFGGLGDDYYLIDQVGEVVTENSGEGTDTVLFNSGSGGTFTLWNNVENGIIAAGPDTTYTLNGNSLNNTLTNLNTSSIVTLDGGTGSDTLIGANVNETFVVDNSGDNVTGGGGAGDVILSSISWDLTSNTTGVDRLTLLNFAAAINALGNGNVNVLNGNSFDNQIDGRGGADVMAGGGGNDTYYVDDVGDTVTEAASSGTDSVFSTVTFTLSANVENLTLGGGIAPINGTGNTENNTITGNDGDNTLDGVAGAGSDVLIGGLGNDYYVSNSSGDTITEGSVAGSDTVDYRWNGTHTLGANIENGVLGAGVTGNLIGNSLTNNLTGNDLGQTLDGQGGTDVMTGLDGDDTYIVDDAGDFVIEAVGKGTDTVYSSANYTLAANVENLILTGSNNLFGQGNADNNSLTGNSGNNTLNGLAGADVMAGGAGDDLYIVDDAGDVVNENASEGTDTVRYDLAGSFTLGANIENGTALAGVLAIDITGNALNNILTGNAGNNSLNGGAGVDTMVGNGGDDTFFVDVAGDVATGGAGTDTVVSTASSYTISSLIENLLAGAGIADNATLTGNAGNNTIDGSLGSSLTMDGGGGADTFIGNGSNEVFVFDNAGDNISSGGNAGDTIVSSITWDLNNVNSGGATNLTLSGVGNNNATGTAAVNTLIGNDGNNSLDGGAGADYMAGGKGNDTYFVDDAGDVVVESAGQGTDTVNSSIDFTLGADIENLILSGTALVGIGSNVSNNITGNDQDNTLDGMAGADAMTGGKGNDIYFVDNVNDQVFENAGEGTDVVNSTVSFTLAANVDNLVLSGLNINGTGNADANTIIGTDGNNTLDGGGGADSLVGGKGDDTYVTDQPGDVLVENPGEGTDTVVAGYSFALASDFENLTLSGTGDFSATGNTANNIITGNSGNNDIDGGTGQDFMAGGAGNDDYVVDDAGDTVLENFGEGTDSVLANIGTYTLTNNVENLLAGAGLTDVVFTGNSLNNTIDASAASGSATLDGGSGADTLIGTSNNDVFVVDNAGDNVTTNGGTDEIQSSISWNLNTNSGGALILTLTGNGNTNATGDGATASTLTGNTGNNALQGGVGNDTLIGGGGNDVLSGSLGDDLYIIDGTGDAINEVGGGGTDTVNTTGAFTLSANVENGVTTGAGSFTLTGNAANNTLTATGTGNVTLNGGGGTDTMINLQAAGSVTFIVDDASDSVTGSAASTDTINSSVNFTLGADQDNLVLTGNAVINGTGNTLANNITGNNAANVLNDGGAGGADVMTGLGGNDTYVVFNSGDMIVETSKGGTLDVVQTNVSFNLNTNGANVENLLAFGGNDIVLTGNGLNNNIQGDAGGDFLSGLGGNDILIGGVDGDILDGGIGKDTLTGGGGADTFLFTAALTSKNADTITDFNAGAGDKIDISNLLTGYVDGVSVVSDFVHITNKGANAVVSVDIDGALNGHKYVTVATITGGAAMNLTDVTTLEAAGTLFLG